MRALPEFTLHRPDSLAEAVALGGAAGTRLLAGGTDLLPNLRRGLEQPQALVDLSQLGELRLLEQAADGSLAIGAGVTLATLASDPLVARTLPALAEAARAVAANTHRTSATLGGNLCQDTRCVFYNQSEWWRATNGYCLKRNGTRCHVAPQGERCHAAFCSDIAPVLLVAGAEVQLASASGTRTLPLAQLYRDDGAAHLALQPGELLVRVRIPPAVVGERIAFAKTRVRGGVDFPLASAAVALRLHEGRIASLRAALSGTNSLPLLIEGTAALEGCTVDEASAKTLRQLVQKQVQPMRSTVTPPQYRREAAGVLAGRLLRSLALQDG
ncbi:4-hydroxybenzoyl-CoA reductase subunit beta [Ramlibacter alkalitolerans]|uniref:4-hydroxybenzoyl-CoA reductase subunit beta n=1 Tax=Ramlibacter alkalitolerans TaxID=2039631 RepID=A0ABS1JHF4_9BURK|nr:4-hydroxybenzoyl-CoA reductase subunit beta [Ramlibacter alkalitolerans]MBL0423641.1 4-hydroxybenzoyl-CoA reductase subunit beta [Ramlibacter alkalitolerans]